LSFTDDTNKPKSTTDRTTIGVAVVRNNFLLQQNLYAIEVLYDNQDPVNSAFLRVVETEDGSIEVPPNSLGRIRDEVREFVEVTPNAVTGKGILSVKLATPQELRAKGFL